MISRPVMKLYFEIAKRSFQRHLTYRAATIAGLITNFFFGFLRVAILIALYGDANEVAGITLDGAITYVGLTQALIGYLSMFSWFEVMQSVYTGEITTDLLKPANFYFLWLAKDVGRAMLNLLTRGVTFMFLYALVFDLVYPTSAEQWIAILFALLLGLLVSFSFRFLINLLAFWTPNALGILRFGFIMSWFFSGFLMPLRYFPDWVITIANFTPFPHMFNSVVEVYIGVLDRGDLLIAFANQVAWIIGLFLLAQLVLRAGIRKLVIQGG